MKSHLIRVNTSKKLDKDIELSNLLMTSSARSKKNPAEHKLPIQQVHSILARPKRDMLKNISIRVDGILHVNNESIRTLQHYANSYAKSELPYKKAKSIATQKLITVLQQSQSLHAETKADEVKDILQNLSSIRTELDNAMQVANGPRCLFKHNGGKIHHILNTTQSLKNELIQYKNYLRKTERYFKP